jgi:hypothetical protein
VTVALLVLADGREEYLAATIASARANLTGPITERWLYAEGGDDAYRARLAELYPEFTRIGDGPRRGFAGAIQDAWRILTERSACEWVFHLEQDFTFNRPVDLASLIEVMDPRPHLVQMALRRQPWNAAERAAGGVVEEHPDWYTDCRADGRAWLEQRMFFTTNPSLYRRSLCGTGFHPPPRSEGMFTHRLLHDGSPEVPGDRVRFGYWGSRHQVPWVEHIGYERAGHGY